MNTFLLGIIVICVVVITAYLAAVLIELKRTIISLRKTTEERINPTIDDLQNTIKNVKDITGDVNKIKEISGAIGRRTGAGAVCEIVHDMFPEVFNKLISLKTGAIAAIGYFLTNLLKKGEIK